MIVLQESSSEQTIKFIPRSFTSGNSYTVKVVNETTGKTVHNASTTGITENLYYNEYRAVLSLKQNNYYTITITGTEVVFKDKIYCTNQADLTSYTVNSGQYTTKSSDNEFITL